MPPLRPPLFVLLLALPLPALAGEPSFDCATAKLPVEKAICRSATLSALDAEIAEAYGRAMSAASNGQKEALRRAQRIFLAARNDAFGLPDEDLEARLGDQIAFLKGIESRGRTTLEGTWRNGVGSIEVTLRPDGKADVSIATAEPTRATWLCDFVGEARPGPTGWLVEGDPASDGWTVTLTPRGTTLAVAANPPAGVSAGDPPPFCGMGGTVDGDYLPVRPPVDWGQ